MKKFLISTTAMTLLGTSLACSQKLSEAAPEQPKQQTPTILTLGYPRAGFFRISESTAANDHFGYDKWMDAFSQLNGIYGKVLTEEIYSHDKPDKNGRTKLDYFRDYKQKYPDKLLLLHFNGTSRIPQFMTEPFFAGHWLYYEGAVARTALSSKETKSVVKVDELQKFTLTEGRFANCGSDVCIARLVKGKPDWTYAEQATVIAIDKAAGTITLERGKYGTRALDFDSGKTYIAAHYADGPYSRQHPYLLWEYNLSLHAPKDPQGRLCGDVLAEQLASLFDPGGVVDFFDGIEFDAFFDYYRPAYDYAKNGVGIDYNGSGVANDAYVNGLNQYGLGEVDYLQKLRDRMPKNKLILADLGQRAFGILNGIESEGFPVNRQFDLLGWYSRYNKVEYWTKHSAEPSMSLIAGRIEPSVEEEWTPRELRVGIAASCLLGTLYFAHQRDPRDNSTAATVWDELVMGRDNKTNWLGMPVGETRELGASGTDVTPDWKGRMTEKVAPNGNRTFTITGVPYNGQLFVCVTASAEGMKGTPSFYPRMMSVNIGVKTRATPALTNLEAYIDPTPTPWNFAFARSNFDDGAPPATVTLTISLEGSAPAAIHDLKCYNSPAAQVREFDNGAVLVNTDHSPYTFDMAALFPGMKFRRLQATPNAWSDPVLNDGSDVGATLTLGRKDAIFLVKK